MSRTAPTSRRAGSLVVTLAGSMLLVLSGAVLSVESAPAFSPNRAARPLSVAEERLLQPADSFKECPECPEMIVVPAGNFLMGSPENESGRDAVAEAPEHRVTIANQFAAGRLPVTLEHWTACVQDGGCPQVSPYGAKLTDSADAYTWNWTAPEGRYQVTIALADDCEKSGCHKLSAGHPVVAVSLGNVQAYLTWLSAKTGFPYRLPSEAEREYMARGGTTTPYYTGSSITKDQANFCDAPEPTRSPFGFDLPDRCAGDIQKLMPAGRFTPNAWGFLDMHGNLYEYTADCIHPNYAGAPADGSAWTASCIAEDPVLRGGSFLGRPRNIRSAARHFPKQQFGPFSNVGFRVVRTLNRKTSAVP